MLDKDLIGAFPPPPLYYKLFFESENLVNPPDPPASTSEFVCFGETHTLIHSIDQFDSAQFVQEFRKNLHITTSSYVEVIEACIKGNFSSVHDPLDRIKGAFAEMHQLIDGQRKLEALVNTVKILEERIAKKKELIEKIDQTMKVGLQNIFESVMSIDTEPAQTIEYGSFIELMKESV